MKDTDVKKNLTKKIDNRFIEAIEKIIIESKRAGVKPNSMAGINKIIHPSNTSYISNVKGGRLHVLVFVLANLAEQYNIDMNYFFYDDIDLKFDLNNFLPANKQEKKNKDPSVFKLSEIDFKQVDVLEEISFETEELAKRFKLDTLIRIFASVLKKRCLTVFL